MYVTNKDKPLQVITSNANASPEVAKTNYLSDNDASIIKKGVKSYIKTSTRSFTQRILKSVILWYLIWKFFLQNLLNH